MATWHLTCDVEVSDCRWGQIFRGTREALIAAGIAEARHFPAGLLPKGKRAPTQLHQGRKIRVHRATRKGVFEIWRDEYSPEEQRAADEREQQARAAARRESLKLPRYPIGYATSLLARLRARYPGVGVTHAEMHDQGRGWLLLVVKFEAPLAVLLEAGLVTSAMVEAAWHRRRRGPSRDTNPIGDGFSLYGSEQGAQLTIYTATSPRERPRIATDDARRLLKRFMLPRHRRTAHEEA